MHVLTKIFIVLVALLSVMLVPLVVVYAKNEGNFKSRFADADNAAAAAETALNSANLNYGSQIASLEGQITTLRNQLGSSDGLAKSKEAEILRLQSELADAKALHAQINSKISVIASTVEAGQNLVNQLVNEANSLRTQALAAERQNAELNQTVREQTRNLEVAEAAVRSLQEEVQRLGEAQGVSLDLVERYVATFGPLDEMKGIGGGPVIDTDIVCNIIDVREAEGVMLAEIDAGQRDGIQNGWVLLIGDGAGGYIGRLRIINVDVNRSTGIAESVTGQSVMTQVGHKAYAVKN